MDKENNVVYVQTKNGIFKCYKSEQMHKPIYYSVESKTNGYIDYYDVIEILNIDDLYEQVKKQKEVIDRIKEYIQNHQLVFKDLTLEEIEEWFNQFYIDVLDILKEVSE
jgi:predicted aldo/keto reductase-like oxidoreductase